MRYLFLLSLLSTLAAQAASLPNPGTELTMPHITFRSEMQTDTALRYVTNSGICETTAGVNQYSGYVEVGKNMSMWFWFFEARHSPEAKPLTLWLNGGPGCSSMFGLFGENGPCGVNPDRKTTHLNPYSWNNVSNMIYMDQPMGVGFSHGIDIVNSTEGAAPFVWKALQILFESQVFSNYANHEFIVGTESYGGHFAPAFVTYFHEQNALIARGEIQGTCIIVSALMINDGWIDPLIQYLAYYNFTSNAPGYGQLQPDSVLKNISDALDGPNGCVAQEKNCYAAGNSPESEKVCSDADDYCYFNVYVPARGNRDPYDLRQNLSALFPPKYYGDYLHIPEVVKMIGAEVNYTECVDSDSFYMTGDNARTFLPQLSKLANSGLKILVWYGDTDIISNWIGGYATVLAMDWYGKETFQNTPLSNITLHDTTIAAVANVDNSSFAVVYAAGHMLPSFQPAAALEIFTQAINKESLHSV